MRLETTPTEKSERSMESISSTGPLSSRTAPRWPQRASRSPMVTGPHASAWRLPAVAPPDAAVIMPAATVPLVSAIDQDECAGAAIHAVEVHCDGTQQMQRDHANAVHLQRVGGFMRQAGDIGAMFDCGDECGHGLAGVLQQIAAIALQRTRSIQTSAA